jgi:hypothetical protein
MSLSGEKNEKKSPSDELLKSIDLWLQWDQCEVTRKEIEQLKVTFSIHRSLSFLFF